MSLRILHTADNHIGLSFSHYPDAARARLVAERFNALEQLVLKANARGCHFFVVAGDLFDKTTVTSADIKRTVDILRSFAGEAVLVLAGNHDFCEGADSKLWKTFRKAAEGSEVHALTEQGRKEFVTDDYQVRFYACPCPGKHGKDHVIGWVPIEEKPPGMLHVGLAHGNVEGIGLDAENRYFNMTEGDLRSAGVHTWLLGHIHVPSPAPGSVGTPLFFMPGIHAPDSVKCSHPGHAWLIELDADGTCRHEQLTAGGVRFERVVKTLAHADDISDLQKTCEMLDAPNTVLDLQLNGKLSEAEIADLNAVIAAFEPNFLHVSQGDQDIAIRLDAAEIARLYPEGTLPNSLLQSILADEDHPGDAHLALEIIQPLSHP